MNQNKEHKHFKTSHLYATCGVPQGLILGQQPFIVYISDFYNV